MKLGLNMKMFKVVTIAALIAGFNCVSIFEEWSAGTTFGYTFDGMGNRLTHSRGGVSTDTIYTPNAVNQYSQIDHAGEDYVMGRTAPGSTITVDGQAASEREGYFASRVNWNGPEVNEVVVSAEKGNKTTQQTATLRRGPTTVSPQYDLDGNLESDGLWTYTWNGENRLIRAESVAGIPAEHRVRKEYTYDYIGRRVEERRYQLDASNTFQLIRKLNWIYDDWNPVVEIEDDQPSRSLLWGLDLSETPQGAGGVGGLLVSSDLTSHKLHYNLLADANGNIVALASPENGDIIGRYEYSPFGEVLWQEGFAAQINRWKCSTKMEDDVLGLLYYGYRYYNTRTGRWPSRDPIVEQGGVNLYSFVGNRVIILWDRLGLEPLGPLGPLDVLIFEEAELVDTSFPPHVHVIEPPGFQRGKLWKQKPKITNSNICDKSVNISLVARSPESDGFLSRAIFTFGPVDGRFTNIGELGAGITDKKGKILRLTIAAHGSAEFGMSTSGATISPETQFVSEVNSSQWLSFFDRDKFCCNCNIWLIACELAQTRVPKLIANRSGCNVYAYSNCPHDYDRVLNLIPYKSQNK